jgi:hypothetical protein
LSEFDQPVFTSLNFSTFFFYGASSSALYPNPNVKDRVSAFMSSIDRVVQLYLQASDSIYVTFYNSKDYGGGMLTWPYMECGLFTITKFNEYGKTIYCLIIYIWFHLGPGKIFTKYRTSLCRNITLGFHCICHV